MRLFSTCGWVACAIYCVHEPSVSLALFVHQPQEALVSSSPTSERQPGFAYARTTIPHIHPSTYFCAGGFFCSVRTMLNTLLRCTTPPGISPSAFPRLASRSARLLASSSAQSTLQRPPKTMVSYIARLSSPLLLSRARPCRAWKGPDQ